MLSQLCSRSPVHISGCEILCERMCTHTHTHTHTHTPALGARSPTCTHSLGTLVLGLWGPGEAGGLPVGGSLVLGLDGGDAGDRLGETESELGWLP